MPTTTAHESMQRVRILGIAATLLALIGYVAGILVPYPGRAFSLAVGMVGIALVGLGSDPS